MLLESISYGASNIPVLQNKVKELDEDKYFHLVVVDFQERELESEGLQYLII